MNTGFDDNIKKVYDSGEFVYSPDNWHRLQASLQRKADENKKPLAGLFGIFTFKKVWAAASILLLVALTAAYFATHSFRHRVPEETAVKESHQKGNASKENELEQGTASGPIQSYAHDEPKYESTSGTKKSQPDRRKYTPTAERKRPYSDIADKPTNKFQSGLPVTDQIEDKGQYIAAVEYSPKNENDPTKHVLSSGIERVSSATVHYPFGGLNDDEDNERRKRITLSGSVGKGANSTVYAAGVNYQRSVGRGFFVEGMLAVYSSNLQNMASFENSAGTQVKLHNSNPTGSFGAEDLANNNVDVKLQTVNYAHLALNPSLGYKLSKRISVKAGVDIQKKISSSKEALYAASEAVYKPLPGVDIGLTPKIGIELSSHWQTTIMYRKGINDLISKKDYFNRNFVLMQLGYAF